MEGEQSRGMNLEKKGVLEGIQLFFPGDDDVWP